MRRRRNTTVRSLGRRHRRGRRITVVTAYDYPSARTAVAAGIDVLLVGDSLGMVVLGYEDTLPVTMEEMLHHAKAVRRGAPTALVIADLPFMSYQAGIAEAMTNAGRFLKEAGADAVKLEGGRRVAETVAALVEAGIPVQGHIGLTPQSVRALGGFRVQGRSGLEARGLVEDALALAAAGCFSIVLEGVPSRLAEVITTRLTIPTIGIGAGPGVSGQVLVYHDLLGLYDRFTPHFARRYAELGAAAIAGLKSFREDVENERFPTVEHGFEIDDEEWRVFLQQGNTASSGSGGEVGE